ncbi:MAG: tetratricopeptide repeat protein [Deltaproteobacteria bacterium]
MTRSPVEKLEQILAADPSSLVFVELAKALIDLGEHARALAVCRDGVERHPDSVQGRFLWGKAFLFSGKPVEAMEQFERTVAIEPGNPYAYNLIGELLVQRKLFRSALPILRKAAALQPGDARVRQWLDQAAGEAVDGLVPLSEQAFADDVTRAFVPAWGPPAAAPLVAAAPPTEPPPAERSIAQPASSAESQTVVIRGPALPPPGPQSAGGAPPAMPLAVPPPLRSSPSQPGLDRRLLGTDASGTGSGKVMPPPLRSSPSGRRSAADLLGDLPDAPSAKVPVASTPGISAAEASRIAQAFESELREGYSAQRDAPPPFFRRHWLALTLAAAAAVAGAVGVSATIFVRRHYAQVHRKQFLAHAQDGLLLDTFSSLTGASHQLDEVLQADPANALGKALAAQAAATLWREYGGATASEERAEALLADPAVATAAPDFAWAARALLASDPKALAPALLALPEASAGPWVDHAAGEALLSRGDAKAALARFDHALKQAPAHVPTLLAVGNYYLTAGDPARAAELFGLARAASPQSVGAAVGLAEAHLALHQAGAEDERSLAAVEAPGPQAVPTAWRLRLDLATARVLAGEGKLDPALARLKSGLEGHGDEAEAYAGALADVLMAGGHYAEAEVQAKRALTSTPPDSVALARLGRILIGRGRYRDLLARVRAVGPDPRQLHVLRARAELALGDCAAVRREIGATERGAQRVVPVGGATLLALCDAKEGHPELARQTLGQLVAMAHPSAAALLGLASVEAEAGELRAAVKHARMAVGTDPQSYEAYCALGRYLVAAGHANQGRRELARAVALDADHEEARLALGLLELRSGQADAALADLQAARAAAPSDPAAELALARLSLAQKQLGEAARHAARAVSLDSKDPEAHRLRAKIAQAAGQRSLAQREGKLAQRLGKAAKTHRH